MVRDDQENKGVGLPGSRNCQNVMAHICLLYFTHLSINIGEIMNHV